MRLVTDYPLAADSPDHLEPRGAKNDDTHCAAFVARMEMLIPSRPVRYLDLGCAGGGLVEDCVAGGHIAFGLEGSDTPRKIGRHAWQVLPTCLATCDISKPFHLVEDDGGPARFDFIGAWEFMEHIRQRDLPQVWSSIRRHLAPAGLFLASISLVGDGIWHQTVVPESWWRESIRAAGLVSVGPFFGGCYPRNQMSSMYVELRVA